MSACPHASSTAEDMAAGEARPGCSSLPVDTAGQTLGNVVGIHVLLAQPERINACTPHCTWCVISWHLFWHQVHDSPVGRVFWTG